MQVQREEFEGALTPHLGKRVHVFLRSGTAMTGRLRRRGRGFSVDMEGTFADFFSSMFSTEENQTHIEYTLNYDEIEAIGINDCLADDAC